MPDQANGRVHVALWLALPIGALLLLVLAGVPEAQDSSASVAGLQARLAGLETQARYLRDRHSILDVSRRYTRGVDRHDKDLVRSAFWPDATVSYGLPMRVDEYSDWQEQILSGYAAHQHHLTGQTIEIDGDTAHVESYVLSLFVPRDHGADRPGPATPGRAATGEKTLLSSGRFVDRWERRGDEWRIAVREYVADLELRGETVDLCASGCLARWDRSDLSYVRPLQRLTPEQRKGLQDVGRDPTAPPRDATESDR
jgi:hypothetical protein